MEWIVLVYILEYHYIMTIIIKLLYIVIIGCIMGYTLTVSAPGLILMQVELCECTVVIIIM